jgi:hypothetical protein
MGGYVALSTQFRRRLVALFRRRAAGLEARLGLRGGGAVPTFSRQVRNREIDRLLELGEDLAVAKEGRRTFWRSCQTPIRWQVTRGKGHGRHSKKANFKKWYDRRIGKDACVYGFFRRNRCLYIGRTEHGGGRPAAHFDRHWFGAATRVAIFVPEQKRSVQMLECLAIHLFQPTYNRAKSTRKRFRSKCPVCSTVRQTRRDLLRLFPGK